MNLQNEIPMHSCHIEDALAAKGLRNTVDRHHILELFHENRSWTVSEIADQIHGPDLSTIYRNVHTLLLEQLIVRTHSHETESRYEGAGRPHHDHFSCQSCYTVRCIPCPVPKLSTHTLELAGICASCR
ncbi:hypothetical protein A2348_02465 [Candidatus Uhrbacteria bacterium RIFOXYB12_FULL_58_10]|nr:MAG: hypothetical protein A2348_02465 [Candidatus Uhrbacteria bacterium RIFOXYB12_FULL_58_10]